jgi:hypothetical protein
LLNVRKQEKLYYMLTPFTQFFKPQNHKDIVREIPHASEKSRIHSVIARNPEFFTELTELVSFSYQIDIQVSRITNYKPFPHFTYQLVRVDKGEDLLIFSYKKNIYITLLSKGSALLQKIGYNSISSDCSDFSYIVKKLKKPYAVHFEKKDTNGIVSKYSALLQWIPGDLDLSSTATVDDSNRLLTWIEMRNLMHKINENETQINTSTPDVSQVVQH